MTKKKNTFPPGITQAFDCYLSAFPGGRVEKIGKSEGIAYYVFVFPVGEDGAPPRTGFPVVYSWDGQSAKKLDPGEAFDAISKFC